MSDGRLESVGICSKCFEAFLECRCELAPADSSAEIAILREENARLLKLLENAKREVEAACLMAKTEHIGMACEDHRGCAGEMRRYCPVCVREERDRYKRALAKLARSQNSDSATKH